MITDELLLQIKIRQLEDPDWQIKVILLSATMSITKFKDYFSHKVVGKLEIPASEKLQPIKTYFIDDLEKMTPEGIVTNIIQYY